MFRVIDNMPEVYLQESRDFQLFARLLDIQYLASKWKLDLISQSYDPLTCNEAVLPFIAETYGFKTSATVDNDALRIVLKVLPWLLKKKGSLVAIDTALRVVLLTQHISTNIDIDIDYKNTQINITTSENFNESLLDDLLIHILPIGFNIEYKIALISDNWTTSIGNSSFVALAKSPTQYHSETLKDDGDEDDWWALGSLGIAEVTDGGIGEIEVPELLPSIDQ